MGGAGTTEERVFNFWLIKIKVKYSIQEVNPGPGRYDPSLKFAKKREPTYYFGEKLKSNSLMNQTGTSDKVGPATYDIFKKVGDDPKNQIELPKYTSIHQVPPHWRIPQAKRAGLEFKTWTVDETYYDYKSCDTQIDSRKKSETKVSFGKSTRDKEEKTRGIYPAHMSKQPTKIRLPHPKFY